MSKLAILALPLFLLATPSANVQPQKEILPAATSIPVGGVLLWWGTASDLPPGFEVCDGTVPFTKNALLQERKPDLRDRFVKCAKDVSSFRPRSAVGGGSNNGPILETELYTLTTNQIPPHTHPIPHQHELPAHNHTLPAHTHPLAAHIHSIGLWVDAALSGAGSQVLTRDNAGTASTSPGGAGATDPGGAGSTGMGGAGLTPPLTRPVSEVNATTNAGHAHRLAPWDNQPAYLEMLYIIRVL